MKKQIKLVYNNKVRLLLVLFVLLACFCIFPYFLIDKPIIYEITPKGMIERVAFNEDNTIIIRGENLEGVRYIKVNGKVDTSLEITEITDTELKVKVWTDGENWKIGENSLQLLSLSNYKFWIKGKKVDFEVKSDDIILEPTITSVKVEEKIENAYVNNSLIKIIGSNFTEDSIVELSGNQVDAFLNSNSELWVKLPDKYTKESNFSIQIYQTSFGIKTSKYSNAVFIENQKKSNTIYQHSYLWLDDSYLISHALGGVDGRTYTNSREALMSNSKKGVKVFEMDLTFTSNTGNGGVLVGRHDWNNGSYDGVDANISNSQKTELPKVFTDVYQMNKKYQVLTFEELCNYMVENPDVYFVTDTKYTNSRAIDYIFRDIITTAKRIDSSILDRVVVQVYNQAMYFQVMELYPFPSVIYTLYMSDDSEEEVIEFVKNTGIGVVAMPMSKYNWDFVSQLNLVNCKSFLHTINSSNQAEYYMDRGVYGVYTDNLLWEDFKYGEPNNYAQHIKDANTLRSINEIGLYLDRLNQSNYTVVIGVKGDGGFGITDDVQEKLYKLGAKEKLQDQLRNSYLFVAKNRSGLYEKLSLDKIQVDFTLDKMKLGAVSAGDLSGDMVSISVDGDEWAINSRGLNFIVIDEEIQSVVDSIAFDTYENRTVTRDDSFEISQYNYMMNYLTDLNNGEYLLLLSIMDDGTSLLDDHLMDEFKKLGMKTDLRGHFRKSFVAILDSGESIYENISEESLEYDAFYQGLHLTLKSAGLDQGNEAAIFVDGIDYAVKQSGINIVVYDKSHGLVIDSIVFALNENIRYTR